MPNEGPIQPTDAEGIVSRGGNPLLEGDISRSQLQYPLDAQSRNILKESAKQILPELNRIQNLIIPSGATSFEVRNSDVMGITAAAGVTIATITDGYNGQLLTLVFGDANVTITDDGSGNDNTINLRSSFTSFNGASLLLVRDENSWSEVARNVVDISSLLTTNGDILYRDASGLQRLGVGNSGQFLRTGQPPSWAYTPSLVDYEHGQQSTNVPDTSTDTVLRTITLPAIINTNDVVEFYLSGQINGESFAAGDFLKLKVGSSTIYSQSPNGTSSGFLVWARMAMRSSLSSQIWSIIYNVGGGNITSNTANTSSVNFGSSQDVDLVANVAPFSGTQKSFQVEYFEATVISQSA